MYKEDLLDKDLKLEYILLKFCIYRLVISKK